MPEITVWSWNAHSNPADPDIRYRDVLGVKYNYDSTVVHHSTVKVGDVVLLRDETWILGHALVGEVTAAPGRKLMRLCRECRRSGVNVRTRKTPAYRCPHCKSKFDAPVLEERDVTVYEAWYTDTWTALPDPLPRTELAVLYAGNDRRNAIRRLRTESALTLLRDHTTLDGLADLRDATDRDRSDNSRNPDATNPPGGHRPAAGRRRLGQQEFRAALLTRFGAACAITGAQPPEVLDAAHLYRFADSPEHHLDGGLLLRSDLHRLLDAFLLTVNTTSWTVQLAPSLRDHPALTAIDGTALQVSASTRPRAELLDEHRTEAVRRWASTTAVNA